MVFCFGLLELGTDAIRFCYTAGVGIMASQLNMHHHRRRQKARQGNVAVLLCLILPVLVSLIAFMVDYGFLLYIRTDLQRIADQQQQKRS